MLRKVAVHLRAMGVALTLLVAFAGAPALAQDTPSVSMGNYAFRPAELHVAPGTTVTWNNPDSIGHTVTADDGSFDSGNMDPGATWTMTFEAPGTYSYYCAPHGGPGGQGMAGVIVVDPQ